MIVEVEDPSLDAADRLAATSQTCTACGRTYARRHLVILARATGGARLTRSARNTYTGGHGRQERELLKTLGQALREQREALWRR